MTTVRLERLGVQLKRAAFEVVVALREEGRTEPLATLRGVVREYGAAPLLGLFEVPLRSYHDRSIYDLERVVEDIHASPANTLAEVVRVMLGDPGKRGVL